MTSNESRTLGVERVIRDLVTQGLGDITTDLRLSDDLGFDSITIVELAVTLEHVFGVDSIEPEQLAKLVTVGDVIEIVSSPKELDG